MTIREEIGKRILFFDGGMGTLLQEQGLQAGELPETWNLKNPEPIIQIHKAYFKLFFTKADSRLKTIENNTAAIISTEASSLTENALA